MAISPELETKVDEVLREWGIQAALPVRLNSLSFTVKTFCTTEVCTMAQHERVKGFVV